MTSLAPISKIFRGTRGPHNARIMIVGEAWGQQEAQQMQPFAGASGQELSRILLQCGIPEAECLFSNVVNARPRGNDMKDFFWPTKEARKRGEPMLRGLYPREIIWDGLRNLHKQIEHAKPDLVIAFGNYALWALTHNSFKITNNKGYKVPSGIASWRGSQLYTINGTPLLPTFHPAAALRNWPWMYLIRHDISMRAGHAKEGKWDNEPEYKFTVRPFYEQVMRAFEHMLNLLNEGPTLLAHDLETRAGHIACSGWAWSSTEAICIPFMTQHDDEGYWTFSEELSIVELQNEILRHPNLRLAGQNYLYDIQYVARFWHVIPHIARDTMIMHHLCYPGTPASLNYISSMYNNFHAYWKEEGKTWEVGVDEEQLWAYNCKDCVVTWEAAAALESVIDYHDLMELYTQDREPQLQIIAKMMVRGARLDLKAQEEIGHELANATLGYQEQLELMLPKEIWPRDPKKSAWYNSPQQLASILYDELRLPVQTKDGRPTTADQALERLALLHPTLERFFHTLQKYRTLCAFAQFATMTTDTLSRVRSMFSPTAETFRWRSGESAFGSGRNLQNLPKGQEE